MKAIHLGLVAAVLLAISGCAVVHQASPKTSTSLPHKKAYQPSALFSPVVQTGNLLFLSGTIGKADDVHGVEGETRRALEKIRDRLALAGATLDDIVKCTVLLDDINDYTAMNGVYQTFWTQNPPARTAVAVKGLPVGALVEIECIAAMPPASD